MKILCILVFSLFLYSLGFTQRQLLVDLPISDKDLGKQQTYKDLEAALANKEEAYKLRLYWEQEEFPMEVLQLRYLHYLDIFGGSYEQIPELESSLPYLKRLRIDGRNLENLPWDIGYMNHLTHLEVIDAKQMTYLPESLGAARKILHLDVSGAALKKFPEYLLELPVLEELRISTVNVTAIPDSAFERSGFERLCLEGEIVDSFPTKFMSFGFLNNLTLSGTKIEELPKEIKKFEGIALFLSFNRNYKTLYESLKRLKAPSSIYLYNDKMTAKEEKKYQRWLNRLFPSTQIEVDRGAAALFIEKE